MSSYRPLGQFVQYFLDDGTVNAGGSITFYETDLTTLKDTWSNPSLTTLNSNPVVLDASGRPLTDIWGDGSYGAVIKDSLGAVVETANNIQSGVDPGSEIPTLVTDEFLSNNGSNLLWAPVLQVPDPTGFTNNILFTDGSVPYWGPVPTPADPDIVVGAKSFQAGVSTDTTKFLIQTGTGTAPASGAYQTSLAITFDIVFDTVLYCSAQPIGDSQPGCPVVGYPAANATGTGVTFQFDIAEGNSSQSTFVNACPFYWIAVGLVTV